MDIDGQVKGRSERPRVMFGVQDLIRNSAIKIFLCYEN